MTQQSSISSFFKRKPESSPVKTAHDHGSPPLKKQRTSSPVLQDTPTSSRPLSVSTKHWHIDEPSSPIPDTPERMARRSQIVAKLGEFDRKKREATEASPDSAEDDSEDNGEPQESDLSRKFANKGTSTAKTVRVGPTGEKLTPLEIQILQIQEENPNTMLLVEVGYKFRFFGPDAKVASEILGIASFKSHSFMTASIPVHRLPVHVKRLVLAGKKVGVVKQIETAALKAIGENKNKTFERKLCEVYSKGTYLSEENEDVAGEWILAIVEESKELPASQVNASQGADPVKVVRIGIIAVRAESGEVVWDQFEDTALRGELEKRLLMLDIVEIIAIGELSRSTINTFDRADRRIENIIRPSLGSAKTHIQRFYNDLYGSEAGKRILKKILDLPDLVLECVAAQMQYLAEFKLESIFTLTNFFQNFESKACMQLPATTISALEIFRSSDGNKTHGSLFWVIDNTRTLPGRRLLRNWLARPLANLQDIRSRQNAVQEVVDARGTQAAQIEAVKKMLKSLPDLDKLLSKIYYGKAKRPETYKALQAFSRVSRTFDPRAQFHYESDMLADTFSSFCTIIETITSFLGEINHVETAKDDKYNMFKESDSLDQISDHKMGILIVENDLNEHLVEICKILKCKNMEYVTVAGIEYLIEVKNDATKLVPREWLKMSGTKSVSRFHTSRITALVAERAQRKELLAMECDKAYQDYLKRISNHYDTLRWIVSNVAEIDCILSLATVSLQPGYCKPTFLSSPDHPTTIDLQDSRHPIIEKILNDPYIPNSCSLSTSTTRAIILTGPNMGGKSSYIKQVALCCILAHIGSYVPCSSATISLIDAIHVRLGASDRILNRQSTFMVELHEVSEIMTLATKRSLVVLDELGRGTATYDGLAISHAVLTWCLRELQCLILFVTHYPSLGELSREFPVVSRHMSYLETGNQNVTFMYKLVEGVAKSSYGLNVARLAGLPESIIASAREKANQMECEMKRRERMGLKVQVMELIDAINDGLHDDAARLEKVIERLETFIV